MSNTWEIVGTITIDNDRLVMPPLPSIPGLYRLTFDDGSLYIGEANDINRPVGDYMTYYPSVGIESEFRINKKLFSSKQGTEISVLTGDEFSGHSQRCIREHQEIKTARAEGKNVLNGGRIEERIAFHKFEIARLEARLQKSSPAALDLDEMMHSELLQNPAANAYADELAREQARKLGFTEKEIEHLIGSSESDTSSN